MNCPSLSTPGGWYLDAMVAVATWCGGALFIRINPVPTLLCMRCLWGAPEWSFTPSSACRPRRRLRLSAGSQGATTQPAVRGSSPPTAREPHSPGPDTATHRPGWRQHAASSMMQGADDATQGGGWCRTKFTMNHELMTPDHWVSESVGSNSKSIVQMSSFRFGTARVNQCDAICVCVCVCVCDMCVLCVCVLCVCCVCLCVCAVCCVCMCMCCAVCVC